MDDQPSERRRSSADPDALLASRAESRLTHEPQVEAKAEGETTYPARRGDSPTPQRPETPRQRSGTPPTSAPMRRVGSADRPLVTGKEQRISGPPQRPPPVSHATYPVRQELTDRNAIAAAMERQRNRNTFSGPTQLERSADETKDERERAAQDVAFERDYVVVEKRAVEVNAFADELAHSPRIHGRSPKPGQGATPARQTTRQVAPSTSPTSAKAMQVVPGRTRADSTHNRQNSYERRYGQSPTSATSAISKALNMASGRLFGVGFSPPVTDRKSVV